MLKRRTWLSALGLAAGLGVGGWAQAQAFPSKPIRLVCPFPPAGAVDIATRAIAAELSRVLGVTVTVDNKPGAATLIGTEYAAKAAPDGYTLVMASIGLAANPSLYKNLNYDPRTEIEPISLLANSPTVLVVPPSLPVCTLAEFVAYAKANPNKLTIGSAGVAAT